MIAGWLFASPYERQLLGGPPLRGPTPWVIAIMSFTILIIAASGLALANSASLLGNAIQGRYSVIVPRGGANAAAVAAAVRSTPGARAVTAVGEQEMRRTLERWLGPEASSPGLPVPAMIDFDAGAGSDISKIERRVAAIAPGASVVAHRETVGPLLRSLRLLQWLAFGLVALLSTAAGAAVVLAARGALDTHRATIEVMHGIGATDIQVTHLFQRKIALDALAGSLVGAAAGAMILLAIAAGAAFAGELTGGAVLNGSDLLLLAILPFVLAALATVVARIAVLASLRRAL
jgi:cell division transport system permease protein